MAAVNWSSTDCATGVSGNLTVLFAWTSCASTAAFGRVMVLSGSSVSEAESGSLIFFFSSRRRHTRSVSAFLLNRSSDLKAASGGIQGDVLATDNNTVGMGDAGIKSAIQGSNVPNPDEAVPSFVSGAMAKAGKGLLEGTLQAGTSAVSDKLLDLVGLGGKSAADKGKDTRDYLAAAFPELNAWERAGADASSAGMVDAGFENQKELTKMQLDNQKEIAEMQNETQKEIAGIQSATSRQNTKDQVYAQNEMLAYQQKES